MSIENQRIEEGDKLYAVYFLHANALFDLTVLHTPVATGDCFVMKDEKGKIYNIQNYEYMVLEKTENEDNIPF